MHVDSSLGGTSLPSVEQLTDDEPHIFRVWFLSQGKRQAEIDPLLWNPETFGLAHHLFISNRTDIAE
jgi:hypothetical protein